MKLSEKSWNLALPIYSRILKHPFITELMDGTLAEEKFLFYINQDALYLADYAKALTALASKLRNPAHAEAFLNFAKDSIYVENSLHETFLKGVPLHTEQSPSCMLYTSYLLKQLSVSSVEVAMAAVLPCFWIYKEVGEYISDNRSGGVNPYQAWINTYGGDEFAIAVKTAVSIFDELAEAASEEERKRMVNAYLTCSKMEWIFWDSAYRMEKWPV